MRSELRKKYLSEPRFERYLTATGGNLRRAQKLYHANVRLAQAFHPILTQFEVVLRNAIHHQLLEYFEEPDWILLEKEGFMQDPGLRHSRFYMKKCVENAERKLRRKRLPIESAGIVAEQSFGFWVSFFLPHHYRLLLGQPIQIFAHKPLSANRAIIFGMLNGIREFRNRVNHCEPICFEGSHLNCQNASQVHGSIKDLISWMHPDLLHFFNKLDGITGKVHYAQAV